MAINKKTYYFILVILISSLFACHKKDFLDEKPSTDLVVPTTLDDCQVLLDNDAVINEMPVLGEVSADNFYLSYSFWQSPAISVKERNAYIWAQDLYQGQPTVSDWNTPYTQVFYANVVLETLEKIPVTSSNELQWKTIKGWALFVRGYAFYNIARLFAPVYDEATAMNDIGIPLRLSAAIEQQSVRSSVKDTYDQIIADLQDAARLLTTATPTYNRNRPTRSAAFAALARTYLGMRVYSKAGAYADSSLQLYNALMDYNGLALPLQRQNAETIYQGRLLSGNSLMKTTASNSMVDTALYRSYDANDLRKTTYYSSTGTPYMKLSYSGTIFAFGGLATDEMYITRAECYARAGNTAAAINDLNTLLITRWKTGTFVPFTASSASQALNLVLTERRKELAFRGLRWMDLRRLNKDGAGITLTRVLNGQTYTLPPNDPKWILPIPPDVISYSGIEQNPR